MRDRLTSGHPRLDGLLGGGLPANAINVLIGLPGAGKTILAQQYVFANATPERPALYFTVLGARAADAPTQWQRAKDAACEALVATGATITHHHAVGTDHRPWMTEEIGPLGTEVLRAVKQVLDPAGVLNPGKTIP